jgi:hypothetical protein
MIPSCIHQKINCSQYISERFHGKKEKLKTYSFGEEGLVSIAVEKFEETPIGQFAFTDEEHR